MRMEKKKAVGERTWVDPDDAPELTDDFFRRADIYEGDILIRRGRPKSAAPKRAVSLRLDDEVVTHFRRGGRSEGEEGVSLQGALGLRSNAPCCVDAVADYASLFRPTRELRPISGGQAGIKIPI
jgi:uncharacterized protein (DUF4415 family)